MNFFSSRLVLFGLLILIAIVGTGCQVFFSGRKTPERIKIADKKQLNQNWLEIIPQTPLVATTKIHLVGLKLKNIKGWADEDKQKLLLTDGSEVKIEIDLVDEKGRSTNLFPNGFGELVEFGKRVENKENIEGYYFDLGTKFNKIRLRSDKPIDTEEIIWMEFEF